MFLTNYKRSSKESHIEPTRPQTRRRNHNVEFRVIAFKSNPSSKPNFCIRKKDFDFMLFVLWNLIWQFSFRHVGSCLQIVVSPLCLFLYPSIDTSVWYQLEILIHLILQKFSWLSNKNKKLIIIISYMYVSSIGSMKTLNWMYYHNWWVLSLTYFL